MFLAHLRERVSVLLLKILFERENEKLFLFLLQKAL
jgi:hypothetical protein